MRRFEQEAQATAALNHPNILVIYRFGTFGVSGTNLEFSKDGKSAVYVSVLEGLLFRAAADGSQRRQLTWAPLTAASPHWSPDGKQIAFAGGQAGNTTRIYGVSSDGGEPRQVSNGEVGSSVTATRPGRRMGRRLLSVAVLASLSRKNSSRSWT